MDEKQFEKNTDTIAEDMCKTRKQIDEIKLKAGKKIGCILSDSVSEELMNDSNNFAAVTKHACNILLSSSKLLTPDDESLGLKIDELVSVMKTIDSQINELKVFWIEENNEYELYVKEKCNSFESQPSLGVIQLVVKKRIGNEFFSKTRIRELAWKDYENQTTEKFPIDSVFEQFRMLYFLIEEINAIVGPFLLLIASNRHEERGISVLPDFLMALSTWVPSIKRAAIVGAADGSFWARTEDDNVFKASQDELKTFVALFNDGQNVPSQGANFNGFHFPIKYATKSLIYGKNGNSGFYAVKTKSAVLIAVYEGPEDVRAKVLKAVESTQGYLAKLGY